MKLTGALSTLLVIVPFLVLEISAAPNVALSARAQVVSDSVKRGKGQGGQGAVNATVSGTNVTTGGAVNSTAAAGAAAAGGTAAEQSSLTLDPSTIGSNLAQNGLVTAEPGQAPSLTSTNNFINFCVGKTITNGLQIQAGSCNPVPMGNLPAKANQPSAKFVKPANMENIPPNTSFTIIMRIQGMQTGAFVNPNTNYFGAPQDLNGQGQIIGHSHVVIQAINGIADTNPPDPTVFSFFQGLNGQAKNGQLSTTVAKGLPAGTYRLFSINTAANHQPAVGPVAQHGSFDDAVYFTVADTADVAGAAAGAGAAANNATAAAGAANGAAANAGNATATASTGATAASAAAAANAGNTTATASTGATATSAAKAATTKAPKGRRSFNISRQ